MRKLLLVAMLLAAAGMALAQENTYEVPGEGSFHYGAGWTKGQRSGAKAVELDWLVNTSDKNVNFHATIARADASYDDWIRNTVKLATPQRVLQAQQEFVTSAGEKAYKLVWLIKPAAGEALMLNQYLFWGKGNTQVLLSGVAPQTDAATFDPMFDSFAKSFSLARTH